MPSDRPMQQVNEQVVEAARVAEVELDVSLELAFLRTELTSDNTLLAWIRTALALMAAGVAYDKAIRLIHDERLAAGTAFVRSANFAGILITGTSVVLLAIATVRHIMIVRALAGHRRRFVGSLPSLLAAAVVILIGCGVFGYLLATG